MDIGVVYKSYRAMSTIYCVLRLSKQLYAVYISVILKKVALKSNYPDKGYPLAWLTIWEVLNIFENYEYSNIVL